MSWSTTRIAAALTSLGFTQREIEEAINREADAGALTDSGADVGDIAQILVSLLTGSEARDAIYSGVDVLSDSTRVVEGIREVMDDVSDGTSLLGVVADILEIGATRSSLSRTEYLPAAILIERMGVVFGMSGALRGWVSLSVWNADEGMGTAVRVILNFGTMGAEAITTQRVLEAETIRSVGEALTAPRPAPTVHAVASAAIH